MSPQFYLLSLFPTQHALVYVRHVRNKVFSKCVNEKKLKGSSIVNISGFFRELNKRMDVQLVCQPD
jgi:hypothetical protein